MRMWSNWCVDPDGCTHVQNNGSPALLSLYTRRGDLSLMTNNRGISLLSIAAKFYNKILLNRIRDEVDPILRKNQAGFRAGSSCAQQIHILRRVLKALEITSYLLLSPLFTSKKPLIPSTGKSCSQFFDTMGFQKL